jgi:hypothetical protein
VTSSALKAKACIDPKAGVELLEKLEAGQAESAIGGWFDARLSLAKAFAATAEKRWTYLWEGTAAQCLLEDE